MRSRLGTQVAARPLGPWADDALCRDIQLPTRERVDTFYATNDADHDTKKPAIRFLHADQAQAICNACPVQAECLTHALLTLEDNGIWGGLVPDARKRLRRYLKAHALHATPLLMRTLLAGWLLLPKSQQNRSIPTRRMAGHGR